MFEQVATASLPLPVVTEEGRLRGVIVRGAVLGALAGLESDMNIPTESPVNSDANVDAEGIEVNNI